MRRHAFFRHAIGFSALLFSVASADSNIPLGQWSGYISRNYTATAPAWEIAWSQADKTAQRTAGAKLLQDISKFVSNSSASFAIQPGTYRIANAITISNTVNFSLICDGAQIIAENGTLAFNLLNNTNFVLDGPLILDGDPFGFTQGSITGTDNTSTVTIQMADGYPSPKAGGRVMFYDTGGNLHPLYQVVVESVLTSKQSSSIFQLVLPTNFWTSYTQARETVLALGTLVCIEQNDASGGINTVGNNGLTFQNITFYADNLLFGQLEAGPVIIDGLKGIRRPGTSRLNTGGDVALDIAGGSLYLGNSEIGYHFDDLTDLQSSLSYAFHQVSPTSVYAGFRNQPPIGTTLAFYDYATLEDNGVANITAIKSVTNNATILAFQKGLTEAGLLNWTIIPVLVTLDSEINMTNTYALIDALQLRATSMVIENCFFHDSQASGINAKGASETVIRNNIVLRPGYRGASVGFDPYWWEGEVPKNILIEGNYVEDAPFSVSEGGQAISTYVDSAGGLLEQATGTPIHNVTIRGNTIVNPKVAGIGVVFVAGAIVTNNTIINPVAGIADQSSSYAAPYAEPTAIFVDCISGSAVVKNNVINNANPRIVSQAILFGYESSMPVHLEVCSNTLGTTQDSQMQMPNNFWVTAAYDSSKITYSNTFMYSSYPATGDRLNSTFTLPSSSQPGAANFSFKGSRVQWLSCTGPSYGKAQIWLDNTLNSTVDASMTLVSGLNLDPIVGLCNQVLFDSGPLAFGTHTISIRILGEVGAASQNKSSSVAVLGFSYLNGQEECTASPAPAINAAIFASTGPSPELSPSGTSVISSDLTPGPGISSMGTVLNVSQAPVPIISPSPIQQNLSPLPSPAPSPVQAPRL